MFWRVQAQRQQAEGHEAGQGWPNLVGPRWSNLDELVWQDLSNMQGLAGMNGLQQAWQGWPQQDDMVPETVACEEQVELEACPQLEKAMAPT